MENSMLKGAQHQPTPLDERSLHLRRLVLRALTAADKGHIGSALSLIEIFRVLYDDIVRHDPKRPTWSGRDRVILSKGHGCLALYALLADHGYFSPSILDRFCARNSPIGGHPERHLDYGIEASTGALGHGLPFATGYALAHRRLNDGVRIFVIIGDGELDEGSNWEALLVAAKHRLSNLIIVVDHNSQQLYGPLVRVLPIEPLSSKLEAFGVVTSEVDGHHPESLQSAFRNAIAGDTDAPRVVICRTIKGKGLAVAEQNPLWHYKRTLGEKVLKEIADHWAGESVG